MQPARMPVVLWLCHCQPLGKPDWEFGTPVMSLRSIAWITLYGTQSKTVFVHEGHPLKQDTTEVFVSWQKNQAYSTKVLFTAVKYYPLIP